VFLFSTLFQQLDAFEWNQRDEGPSSSRQNNAFFTVGSAVHHSGQM